MNRKRWLLPAVLCTAVLTSVACTWPRSLALTVNDQGPVPDRSEHLLVALAEWRRMQHEGSLDNLAAIIAPAAPSFVDSRSQAAVAENSRRMRAGTYGYEVLTARSDGDAGVAALLVAWTDRDGPRNAIYPLYCWFHEGRWKYLPNPGEVETWYQDVPEDLEPRFERLASWFAAYQQQEATRLEESPAAMIARWGLAVSPSP